MPVQEKTLVITGANIIDVLGKTIHKNNVILCVGGKITNLGDAEYIAIPKTFFI